MIRTEFLFSITAYVASPLDIGECPAGTRRIIPVLGGSFSGPRISGKLLQGGSDLQLIRADGVAELNVHAALEENSGARILLRGLALRARKKVSSLAVKDYGPVDVALSDETVYFREAMIFETASENLSWINHLLAIATGKRYEDRVELEVFEVM
jgi:hypothetical protein